MYNLIECDNYSKKSGCSWQYHSDEPNYDIKQESFKFKLKITDETLMMIILNIWNRCVSKIFQ